MNQQDRFRIFYNHTIHPELMRLERNRISLLRLLVASGALLLALIAFELYIGELVVFLAFSIPITLYIIFLLFRVRRFIQTFKPRVMNLILDFIDDAPNMGALTYDSTGFLPKSVFHESRLFADTPLVYEGEDMIRGRVGEMDFELCELNVQGSSPVSGSVSSIFKGIFLHAVFSEETHGKIVIWPRRRRQFMSKAIREFTRDDAENADEEILNPAFSELFMVYATKTTHVAGVLSEPVQEAIVRYSNMTGRDLFLAFIETDVYLAVDGTDDILEPRLFRSNVHFDLVDRKSVV